MFAQWDDHEVTNDWCPGEPPRREPMRDTSASLLAARGAPRVPRIHADARDAGRSRRVYRKISYGPLLDVFMLDMRSYRGPNDRSATASTRRTPFSGRRRSPGSSAS